MIVLFGLSNSPAVFQRYINTVFKELIATHVVLTYMDDLIIPTEDPCVAVEGLKAVFTVASQFGLEINYRSVGFYRRK